MEQALHGRTDLEFLKRVFGKLSANFGWWVNRKDRSGNNLYEGGFLGLDNIGVFDRSAPLPTGGYLEQADGTASVALFCQNMLEIACELAPHDPVYEDLAANFGIQFLLIARSERDRRGWHVGRRRRLLLRRLVPAERNLDAAQGPLGGRSPAALRRHRYRAGAAREDTEIDGALPPPGAANAGVARGGSTRREPAILAWRAAA
jgi:hypothetical protein